MECLEIMRGEVSLRFPERSSLEIYELSSGFCRYNRRKIWIDMEIAASILLLNLLIFVWIAEIVKLRFTLKIVKNNYVY